MAVWGKIWEEVMPANELVLSYFWCCYICVTFGKNRSRNATVRVHTDRHTLCCVTETI